MHEGIQILTFYLLNDNNSKNTIMILEFLDKYINLINNSGFKVKFNLIKTEDTKNAKFMDFVKKNNINNIPCIINESNNDVISGIDDVFKLLSMITEIAMNKNNNKEEDCMDGLDLDEEERYNMFTQNYIYTEMSKEDKDDDRFDEEDNKKDMADKLRAFEKQRKGCGNNKNNVKDTNNGFNDDFETKLFNKVKGVKKEYERDVDEDSLTKQLLDKMDDVDV